MQPLRLWIAPRTDADASWRLAEACALPPAVARVLWHRGHRSPAAVEALLAPESVPSPDPFAMAGMQPAATRVAVALRSGEHIVVNGDYDADGVTGTALLVSELRALGGRVDFFVPDRERDGYGITPRLVRRAGEVGVRVLLSVDCGSSDHEAIAAAQAAGIDVIVVDHHEIPRRPGGSLRGPEPEARRLRLPLQGPLGGGGGLQAPAGAGQRHRHAAARRGARPGRAGDPGRHAVGAGREPRARAGGPAPARRCAAPGRAGAARGGRHGHGTGGQPRGGLPAGAAPQRGGPHGEREARSGPAARRRRIERRSPGRRDRAPQRGAPAGRAAGDPRRAGAGRSPVPHARGCGPGGRLGGVAPRRRGHHRGAARRPLRGAGGGSRHPERQRRAARCAALPPWTCAPPSTRPRPCS